MAKRLHPIVLQSIAKRYRLQLRQVVPCHSLYKRSAAYRASTSRGDVVIKPFYKSTVETKLTTEQQITRAAHYIRHLKECAYAHMPHWFTTRSGQYWVKKNGRPLYVTEWIDGRNLNPDQQDYEMLGRAMAKLHTISNNNRSAMYPFSRKQIQAFQWQDRLFRRRLPAIRSKKTALGEWLRNHGDQCITLANDAWKDMDSNGVKLITNQEIKHPAIIHGDITFPNVIIRLEGLFLIDWDGVRSGSGYYELAQTVLNVTQYNPLLMHALLRGYDEIRPLQPAARLLVSGFFRLPREAWQITRSLAFGRGRRVFGVLQRTWEDRLNAVRWMDEWADHAISR